MSDTMIHRIARATVEDGRPMVLLYFADCDPSGWGMPIAVARKLQAFRVALYPKLEFRVYRVGLTPDQVREYDLPSAPLKATEKRADKWRDEMGIEQTEIDALAALRPTLLRQIAEDAIAPFYDSSLGYRVARARNQWEEEAQAILDETIDEDQLVQLRGRAEAKLEEVRAEIAAINEALRVDISEFDLPALPAIPAPAIDDDEPLPLVDSRWSFVDQSQALVASKAYREVPRG
jgi:hypothetical protein